MVSKHLSASRLHIYIGDPLKRQYCIRSLRKLQDMVVLLLVRKPNWFSWAPSGGRIKSSIISPWVELSVIGLWLLASFGLNVFLFSIGTIIPVDRTWGIKDGCEVICYFRGSNDSEQYHLFRETHFYEVFVLLRQYFQQKIDYAEDRSCTVQNNLQLLA